MKKTTFTTKNLEQLKSIGDKLRKLTPLNIQEQKKLAGLLSNMFISASFKPENLPEDESVLVRLWQSDLLEKELKKWQRLFVNLPGYDYCPYCVIVKNDNELLKKNIVLYAIFAPSFAYNRILLENRRGYEIHLKSDGGASFWFPSFEDAEQYPELFNFKGTWTEAYYLLIETLKKGWPMEEFPDELKPLLKK